MANVITGSRILLSIVMSFCRVFSPAFYICYLLAGFTDMIDGTIARKLGTADRFGERLDTVADMVFVVSAAFKILPVIDISGEIIIWIGIIALIKLVNILSGIVMYKKFVAVHSSANKLTGALLFVFPLSITIVSTQCGAIIVCAVATFAAVQEGHRIRTKQIE